MSDSPGAYDPNAIDGEKPRGVQYVSIRDLRTVGIGLLVAAPFMFFAYRYFKGNADKVVCTSNLKAMYDAVNLYAEQHDNRFPPIARTELDGVTPSLDEKGSPYTWVSDVAPFMGTRHSFVCPTATAQEAVRNESAASTAQVVASTYGMYSPYGSVLNSLVETPDEVVLIAETSDRGAQGTLDPKPFGADIPDGFVIGWNDTNSDPGKATERVTRLAFPNQSGGGPARGRHGTFIQAMSASGQLLNLGPNDTQFHAAGGVNRHWRLPPGYRPSGSTP